MQVGACVCKRADSALCCTKGVGFSLARMLCTAAAFFCRMLDIRLCIACSLFAYYRGGVMLYLLQSCLEHYVQHGFNLGGCTLEACT